MQHVTGKQMGPHPAPPAAASQPASQPTHAAATQRHSELFLRVHWVAVPKAWRARRPNRRWRMRGPAASIHPLTPRAGQSRPGCVCVGGAGDVLSSQDLSRSRDGRLGAAAHPAPDKVWCRKSRKAPPAMQNKVRSFLPSHASSPPPPPPPPSHESRESTAADARVGTLGLREEEALLRRAVAVQRRRPRVARCPLLRLK
jgi:hypothetical protein